MKVYHNWLITTLILFFCISNPVLAQQDPEEYRKTIEMADNYFAQGDFINAKASYQIAVRLAPDDSYAKEMLQQSLAMIKQQMQLNVLYTEKIVVADELFKQDDLEGASKVYMEALEILPADTYATSKIEEIGKTLADRKQLEINYSNDIADGDKLLKEDKLEDALAAYKKASSLKPAENYPKSQAAAIEKLLAERAVLADDFTGAMAAAEDAVKRNKFDEAIRQLEQAATLKPGDPLATRRLEEVKKLKADREAYNLIIEAGDNLYIEKEFTAAREKYLEASALKPDDDYPTKMLEKIEIALMDIHQANQSSYEQAIALADKYYNEQDYDRAMVEYRNARRFKPDDTYAQQRIDNILQTLAVRKSQAEAYNQAIAKADNLFKEKRYEEARGEYSQAISINAFEQYPKVKIDEIDIILAELKNQREIYSGLIKGADKLFFADNYVEALEQYKKASDLFPTERYPQDQMTMIYEILGIKDQYDKTITEADRLLFEKKYDEALNEFRKASELDGKEVYPQGKIYEIESLIAEQQKQDALRREYDSALAIADDHFRAGELELALAAYQSALVILPGESYPGRKMEEIQRIKEEKAAQETLDQQFAEAIAGADKLMAAGDYNAAIAAYQAALGLKPGDPYPQQKITEINQVLGEIALQEARDQEFNDAMTKADDLFAAESYGAAIAAYEAALKLKPSEQGPRIKIDEINTILGEIAAKEALEKQYDQLVADADKLFDARDYTAAMSAYQSALALKPEANYPQVKLSEINAALGEIAAKEALDKQYAGAIARADQLLTNKDYQQALLAYESALKLKPGEKYPSDRIAEARAALDEIAALNALEKKYAETIAEADDLLKSGNYEAALVAYRAALELKPGEKYAADQITEVTATVSEIAAREALDKEFATAIATADQHLTSKDYTAALSAYQVALNLKPAEQYPKEKISEINALLGEIAAKEALDKQYNEAIASADDLMAKEDYTGAMAAYQAALNLKPGEQYPQSKIDGIVAAREELERQYNEAVTAADKLMAVKDYENALVSYQAALTVKPGDSHASAKVSEVTALLADIAAKEALDKQYSEAVTNADKLFNEKNYPGALEAYRSALGLKPAESYPKAKVTELESILADIAAQEALDKEYAQIIAEADGLLVQENYAAAKTKYESAAKLKPRETYVAGKLVEIDAAVAEKARLEEISKKYNDAIAFGDKHLAEKDYENARYEFQVANSVKPEEAYPLQKIAEIDAILAEIQRQKDIENQYNKAIASADEFFRNDQLEEARASYKEAQQVKPSESYPGAQLVAINQRLEVLASQREEAYQAAIVKADNYLQQGEYEMAKIQYDRAIELKPNEVYPLDKLKLVNEQIMKKKQIVQEEYDKMVADADKYYASKIYDNAIESYRAAALLKADEEYPKEMVRRILKLLSDRSIVQINKDPLLIPNSTTQKFDFLPVPVKDRRSNYLFFRARNVSDREYKLIINFGQDMAKNGGVVVKVPADAEIYEFIVRISAQYKWFSDDNNWITFYPEGGDLEVGLLQISYSD